jgi:hypothetical protein
VKLHNEEVHNLYSSFNIVRAIKSRMRWAGNVHMERMRNTEFWLEDLAKNES